MLSSKDKATIRSYAQTIKPIFQIGSQELHDKNLKAIKETFNNKEVVKVKVNRVDKQDSKITKQIANEIQTKIDVEVVGVIGTTIILYKQHQDPEKRLLK